MGRKIPGRKHHGVRDPAKQRNERFKKIKDKINAPPTNPDDQYVPKTLQRLVELRNRVKNGDFKRKKTKKIKPKQMFEQYPNEPDRVFLQRVNRECAVVKHEAAFEQKFGVELKRNEEGEVVEVKKGKDPIQMMLKEVRKQKKEKKKKKVEEEDVPKLTKSQKRSLKLSEKKKKKLGANVDEFSKFQDKVKFGELAHAPPTLTVPKRIKKDNETPRPGKKNLLLKSMLNKTDGKVIDKTKKRKDLPNALRRQLDKQQQEVIEAYRLLKEKKREVIK